VVPQYGELFHMYIIPYFGQMSRGIFSYFLS
jgi:hypothetical protein